jgi:putative MATE family efflux protein
MRARRGVNLTVGPVGRHLIGLGMFLALSVISLMVTAVVDIYFVAQLGTHAVAALSFTFPVLMIMGALSMGLGNGVIAVVARAIGQDDHQAVRVLSTDALLLGLCVAIVLAAIGYNTMDPMFRLLGADADVLPLVKQYMHVWYFGMVVQIIPLVGQSIIRAHGDTRTPGLISATMCVLNVTLDPIFILGWGPVPAYGLEGAAIANVLARFVSLSGVIGVLYFRLHALAPVSLSASRIRDSWRKLLHIGLPATATQMVMPVSAALLTKIVALSGTMAVAAYGVASRIEGFTAIYLWAVAGALPAFVGQNAGAGRMDRVRDAVGLAIRFCVGAGALMSVVAFMAGNQIVSHFTKDAEVQTIAVYYLRVSSLSYVLSGLVLVGSQTMNALARPLPASIVSLARTIVITVPFALVGQWLGQIHGVFIGISLSAAACGALALVMMRMVVAQEAQRHAAAVT